MSICVYLRFISLSSTRTRWSGVERQETSKIHRQDAKNAKKSAVIPTSNPPWRPWRLGGEKIQVTREDVQQKQQKMITGKRVNGWMIAVVAALMTGVAHAQTTKLIDPGTGAGDDIKNGGFESGSTAPSAIPAPCQPPPKPSFAPKSARLRKKQREENRQPRMTRINTNGFQTKPPRHSRHGIRVHLCPFVVREYRNGRS